MLGFSAISTDPLSTLDSRAYVVVPNPSGAYGKPRRGDKKLYIIDGEKVYLNKAELQRALDALRREEPVVEDVQEIRIEESVPYQAQQNDLAAFMAQQAAFAAQQAEIQRRLEIQAAAEREILMRWMEERRRDEEEALLVLL